MPLIFEPFDKNKSPKSDADGSAPVLSGDSEAVIPSGGSTQGGPPPAVQANPAVSSAGVSQPSASTANQTEKRVSLPPGANFNDAKAEKISRILEKLGAQPQHIRYAIERARNTSETLPDIMRDFGFVSPEVVAQALAEESGLPYFSIDRIDHIDPAVLGNFKMPVFRGFVPVESVDGKLHIAISELALETEARNTFHQHQPALVVASEQTIQTIFRRYYANSEAEFDTALAVYEAAVRENREDDSPGLVQDIIGALVRHACYSGASDLYLYKSELVGVIKLKTNGVGFIFRSIKGEIYDKILNKLVMENSSQEALRNGPQEATIEFKTEEAQKRYEDIIVRYGFRLQLMETRKNRMAVVRVLDRQSNEADFKKLGFDVRTEALLDRYINTSNGLVIITGPTGSGKTTTLYALLKQIDPVERSIFTIENPIEYRHGLWMQNEIKRTRAGDDEGAGYETQLNSALRSAPDVILFGEIRNNEKLAATLLDAANTGHLVFTTLHTNDAPSALNRLRNMNVDVETLADVMEGILAQRLVRVLCPHCKKPDTRTATLNELRQSWLDSNVHPMMAEGCEKCYGHGYRGRTMVYEILDINSEIRSMIEQRRPVSEIAQAAIKPGQSIWDFGLRLVAGGVTSIDELRKKVKRR